MYSSLRNTARTMVSKYGAPLKVITTDGTLSASGVRVAIKQEGQTTAETEAFLISSAISRAPQVGDIIVSNKLEYRITSVDVTNPGGTIILYKCYV